MAFLDVTAIYVKVTLNQITAWIRNKQINKNLTDMFIRLFYLECLLVFILYMSLSKIQLFFPQGVSDLKLILLEIIKLFGLI